MLTRPGSTVARFAGDTVHQRLAALPLYQSGSFEQALSRAFLATDEDLRANPDFKGDPSGCTAVGIIVDSDLRIICVSRVPLLCWHAWTGEERLYPGGEEALCRDAGGAEDIYSKDRSAVEGPSIAVSILPSSRRVLHLVPAHNLASLELS